MAKLKRNSFVGGAGIYLFSNILNALIPFILLPILTRYLSPAEYGEVAIFQTLVGALGAFVGVTFTGAAVRKYYDNNLSENEHSQFIGTCIQLVLFFSIIVFFIIFLFQARFSEWFSLKATYIMYAVFVASGSVIIRFRLGQWQVRKKAIQYGGLQISQSLFNMLLSLFLVVFLLKGSEGRINAQMITILFFVFIAFLLLIRSNLLNVFIWRKDYVIDALKYGLPLVPHVAGLFLLSSVDRLIISKEIGIAEAGVYMVAVQLTIAMSIVFDAINKAYVPWLFEKLKKDDYSDKKKIVKLTYLWFIVILIGVVLLFFIGPWLVVFIAGDEYAQAGEVIGWLALGQGFNGMYLMVTNYIIFSKKTILLSSSSIASGILNLILLFFFIRYFGLKGAAIAFSLSMSFRFLLTWWLASKCHEMPWFSTGLKRNI